MVDTYLLAKKTVLKRCSKKNPLYPFLVTCLYALLCEYSDYADTVIQIFLECEFFLENDTIGNIVNKYKLAQFDVDLYCGEEDDYVHYGISGPGYQLSSTKNDTLELIKNPPFIACTIDFNEIERVINTFCHEMGHLIKGRENACFVRESDGCTEYILRSGYSYSYYRYYSDQNDLDSFQRFSILDEAINCLQTSDAMSYIPSLSFVEDPRILEFISSLDQDILKEDCGYEIVVPIVRILWEDEDTRRVIKDSIVENGMMDFLNYFSSVVGGDSFLSFIDALDAIY